MACIVWDSSFIVAVVASIASCSCIISLRPNRPHTPQLTHREEPTPTSRKLKPKLKPKLTCISSVLFLKRPPPWPGEGVRSFTLTLPFALCPHSSGIHRVTGITMVYGLCPHRRVTASVIVFITWTLVRGAIGSIYREAPLSQRP